MEHIAEPSISCWYS